MWFVNKEKGPTGRTMAGAIGPLKASKKERKTKIKKERNKEKKGGNVPENWSRPLCFLCDK